MKAIAIADLHINKLNRIDDTTKVLRQISKFAKKNDVDYVYIVGDIYNNKRPHNVEKLLFYKFVKSLSNSDIQVVILSGNHDVDKDNISAVDEFNILNIPNITLVDNPSIVDFGDYKIFLGHFMINGAKLGSLNYNMEGSLTVEEILKNHKADFYILGDVHKHQILHENPIMLYTGSPERIDFGERNEDKGFIYLTTENNKLEYKHIITRTRAMLQYDIDNTEQWINSNILPPKDCICKIKIKCTDKEYITINENEIREKLQDAYSVKIEYDIHKDDKTRNVNITEDCTVIEAFKCYSEEKKLDEETVRLGLKVIEQVV